MDSERADVVMELPGTVVEEVSEETVGSDCPDVVLRLPGTVMGEASEETVGSD